MGVTLKDEDIPLFRGMTTTTEWRWLAYLDRSNSAENRIEQKLVLHFLENKGKNKRERFPHLTLRTSDSCEHRGETSNCSVSCIVGTLLLNVCTPPWHQRIFMTVVDQEGTPATLISFFPTIGASVIRPLSLSARSQLTARTRTQGLSCLVLHLETPDRALLLSGHSTSVYTSPFW